jgi:hypothetical protein
VGVVSALVRPSLAERRFDQEDGRPSPLHQPQPAAVAAAIATAGVSGLEAATLPVRSSASLLVAAAVPGELLLDRGVVFLVSDAFLQKYYTY